jgi:pimeloyl-ACP methyl ester carboxylesterase
MPTLHANGIDIYYEVAGDGPPLLLIMGLGYGAWAWWRQVPAFTPHHRVITFDNRGVGRTSQPDIPYTIPMLADDTAALLTALGIDRAHILGHSLGGWIAQELALSHPDLIDRLILCGTSFGGPNAIPVTPAALSVILNRDGDIATLYRRGISVATSPDFRAAHSEIVDYLVTQRLAQAQPTYAYARQAAAGLTITSEDRLARITAPTLVVAGANDLVVPAANADLLADRIPHARVALLPGAGHLFPIEQPDRFNQTVLDFLHE